MIKAAIYDLDDLMVNSYALHTGVDRRLLKDLNYRFSDLPIELKSNFVGKRVKDIWQEIFSYLKLDIDLETFYEKRMRLFLEVARNELEIMPGLVESLKLFKLYNYKIALASSAIKPYINLVLDKFGLRDYFGVIVSGDSVKIGKPHPETYLVASEKLGYRPEECVVLEDAKNGIESAKGAGCKCVAIFNPYTPPQDRSGADIVLNSLKEITIEMIKSLA